MNNHKPYLDSTKIQLFEFKHLFFHFFFKYLKIFINIFIFISILIKFEYFYAYIHILKFKVKLLTKVDLLLKINFKGNRYCKDCRGMNTFMFSLMNL